MADPAPLTPAPAGPVVVALPAEMDVSSAGIAGGQLAAALVPGVRVIIADMTATTFCDSHGARMLVLAWQWAIANGTEMRLAVPHPGALRTLQMLGIDTVLPVYPTLGEALSDHGEPQPGNPLPGPGQPATRPRETTRSARCCCFYGRCRSCARMAASRSPGVVAFRTVFSSAHKRAHQR